MKQAIIGILLYCIMLSYAMADSIDIPHKVSAFNCAKFSTDSDYTESCQIEFIINEHIPSSWKKISCFGEIEWYQISNGKIETHEEGYLTSFNKLKFSFSPPAGMLVNVIFPKTFKALDPKHLWSKCIVIETH